MAVYHWTSQENYKLIMKTGLRKGSFVVAKPDNWRGEVCLKIDNMWLLVDEETWQGVTHRLVMPQEIEIII